MRISVIGCGYLGAVHAAAMASIGHEVVGIDVDARKVEALSQGKAPFFEPGLPEILTEGVASGRLTAIPYSLEVNDHYGFFIYNMSPREYADTLIRQFERLASEGERSEEALDALVALIDNKFDEGE